MDLKEYILNALKNVIDPELKLNIVELGLIYNVKFRDDGYVIIDMTFTAPGCPFSVILYRQARQSALKAAKELGYKDVVVRLVFNPKWTPAMMSPEARRKLAKRGINVDAIIRQYK